MKRIKNTSINKTKKLDVLFKKAKIAKIVVFLNKNKNIVKVYIFAIETNKNRVDDDLNNNFVIAFNDIF